MIPAEDLHTWTRQDGADIFTVSTDPAQVQLDALNAAFASDMLYWARPLEPHTLRRCVQQSLCFGLYHHVHGEGQAARPDREPTQAETTPGVVTG